MSDTSHHLEREIEAHRAGVEETLDKLKQRMSVDQIVDEVGQFLGMDDVRGALKTAGQQVRDNPIAIGMIGVGLAWLMFGRSGSSSDRDDWDGRTETHTPYSGAYPVNRGGSDFPSAGGAYAGDYGSHDRGGDSEDGGSLMGKARHVASDLGESLGEAPRKMRKAVGHATDRVQSAVGSVRDSAKDLVAPVTRSVGGQPLLMGAAALAAGAVIGSALPRTRTEDRLLGPQRDRLLDEASSLTREMGDRAVTAAKATYDAAARAARDEGLIPEGETIAEKVERVASAAVEEAKSQVEPVLHGEDEPRKAARARR